MCTAPPVHTRTHTHTVVCTHMAAPPRRPRALGQPAAHTKRSRGGQTRFNIWASSQRMISQRITSLRMTSVRKTNRRMARPKTRRGRGLRVLLALSRHRPAKYPQSTITVKRLLAAQFTVCSDDSAVFWDFFVVVCVFCWQNYRSLLQKSPTKETYIPISVGWQISCLIALLGQEVLLKRLLANGFTCTVSIALSLLLNILIQSLTQ